MEQELLLLIAEHHTHGDKWILNHSTLSLCLGCCIISLEDSKKSNVHKKFILTSLLENLHKHNQNFTEVISKDENICIRVMQVLLELIGQEDNLVASPAADCLALALKKLSNNKLDDLIVENLIKLIDKDCNYEHCLLKLHLIGNLCNRNCNVTAFLLNQEQFLQFLLIALNYPCNKTKIAIISIFIEMYKLNHNFTDISKIVHSQVLNIILSELKNNQAKDLQLNALALLHVLVQKENMMELLFELNAKELLPFALKQLLSSRDSLIQVSATQLICHLINGTSNSKWVIILMDANIPEFIFEAFITQNELLIESLLCCISLFIKYKEFFESCHAIYGIDLLLHNNKQMLEFKNWRLSTIGLNLTSLILEKCNLLPCPIPLSVFNPLIKMSIQSISRSLNNFSTKKELNHSKIKFSNINNKKNNFLMEKHILTALLLLESAIKLLNEYNSNPVVQEETFNIIQYETKHNEVSENKSQEDLLVIIINSLEETFLPFLTISEKYELNEQIIIQLFETILAIYNAEYIMQGHLNKFNKNLLDKKFVSFIWHCRTFSKDLVCFQKIKDKSNILLKHMLINLLKEDNIKFDNYFKDVETGIDYLDDTFDTCHFILSQCTMTESDFTLLAAQSAYLLICYICFVHEDRIISSHSLQSHLIIFIKEVSEFSINSFICRHLLFLLATIMVETLKTNNLIAAEVQKASMKLKKMVLQLENPSLAYTHHKTLLLWIVLFKDESDKFCKFIIYEWLKECRSYATSHSETAKKNFDLELLFENIYKDITLQNNFMKIHEDEKDYENNKMFRIIEILNNKLPYILVKLFMDINSKENIEIKITSILNLLIWCRQNSELLISTTQDEIKLIFQILNYIIHSNLTMDELSVIWQYLHITIINLMDIKDIKILFTKVISKPIITQLEECINSNESKYSSVALGFLSGLVNYYSKYNLKLRQQRVTITVDQLLYWLQESNLKNHLYALQILKELLIYNFEHPIIFLKHEYASTCVANSSFLNKDDYRMFFFSILNIIVKMNDIISYEAIQCLLKLVEHLKNRNSFLANHCLSLPWLKIVIETRSIHTSKDSNDEISWRLLLLCVKSSVVNESLIQYIIYIASKFTSIDFKGVNMSIFKEIVHELCTGVYNKYLQMNVKTKLQEIFKI